MNFKYNNLAVSISLNDICFLNLFYRLAVIIKDVFLSVVNTFDFSDLLILAGVNTNYTVFIKETYSTVEAFINKEKYYLDNIKVSFIINKF